MSNLQDTDSFLVSRDGVNYSITSYDMSDLRDTDLLLVSRDGVNYKIEAQDLDLVPPEVPVVSGTITDLATSAGRFTDEQFRIDISVQDAAKRTDQEVKPYVVATYVPEYDLHGLRFDTQRLTGLKRTTNIGSTWTLSTWFKLTSASGDFTIASQVDTTGIIMARPDGTFFYCGYSTSTSYPLNTWHHLVVAVNGNQVKMYVDGNLDSDVTVGSSWGNLPLNIGLSPSASANNRSAYLSEVYFVEAALPASVFGGPVDGVWLPKSYDEIVAEIPNYPIQPYNTRANTDQVWSNGAVVTGSLAPSGASVLNGFDGSSATDVEPAYPGSTVTFTLPGGPYTGKLSLRLKAGANNGTPDGAFDLKVDGVSIMSEIAFPRNSNSLIDCGTRTVSTITIGISASNPDLWMSLSQIRIDGRVLVDQGVWNNSQNWSDDIEPTSALTDGSITAIYDGSLTTYATFDADTEIILLEDEDITASTLRINSDQGRGTSTVFKVNGTTVTPTPAPNGAYQWITLTGWTGPIQSFSVTEVGSQHNIRAVEVDGAILVDSGAQWNSSQLWSNTVTPSNNNLQFPLSNGFNGIITGGGGVTDECAGWASNGPVTLTFPAGLNIVNELVVYYASGSGSTCDVSIDVAGTTLTDSTSGFGGSSTFTGASGDLNSVTITSSGGGIRFYGIAIDGSILVDQASFGSNGFYLPFDPEATGVIYSSTYGPDITPTPTNSISSLFDGSVTTKASFPQGDTVTFTPATPISYSKSLAIIADVAGTVSLNGVDKGATPGAGAVMSLASGSGTLTELKFVPASGTNYLDWSALIVDGVLLVDHNSIGCDASGNENNFHDQNFVLTGSGQDTVLDTPVKNYAVLDAYTSNKGTVVNGSLVYEAESLQNAQSTLTMSSGKYYIELTNSTGGLYNKVANAGNADSIEFIPTSACVVGMAIDVDGSTCDFYKDGVLDNTKSMSFSGPYYVNVTGDSGQIAANFGQQPFIHTPPEGYDGLFQEAIDSGSSGGGGSSPSGSYSSGRLYLVLDPNGNVVDMQSEDPGYVVMGPGKDYRITWPLVLPSGEAPDVELPEGTQICAEVRSTNDSGSDEELTNHLTPS